MTNHHGDGFGIVTGSLFTLVRIQERRERISLRNAGFVVFLWCCVTLEETWSLGSCCWSYWFALVGSILSRIGSTG